jgi:hypothetical protein
MKKLVLFIVSFLSLTFVISCKKDFVTSSSETVLVNVPKFTKAQQDRANTILTQTLAVAVKQEAVRKYIKEKVTEQFDGDFDLLYAAHKNDKIVNGKTFSEVLFDASRNTVPAKYNTNNAINSVFDLEYFKDSIALICPLLNICVPAIFDGGQNWNVSSTVPKVIAKMSSYAVRPQYLTAYDANGNTSQVAVYSDPNELYIVVGFNERIIALAKDNAETFEVTCSAFYEDAFYKNFYKADYYEYENARKLAAVIVRPPIPPVVIDGPPPAPLCERETRNYKDELVRVKFNTIAQVGFAEAWPDSHLELVAIAQYDDVTTTVNALFTLKKMLVADRMYFYNSWWFAPQTDTYWVNMESEIFKWDRYVHGERMKYSWYEEDNTGTATTLNLSFEPQVTIAGVKVKLSSVGGSVSFNEANYDCGESMVEFCDRVNSSYSGGEPSYGQEYNTNTLRFEVRERWSN